MTRKKPVLILIGIISFLLLLAGVGLELTCGLSFARGLKSVRIKEMYLMGNKDYLYMSIDLDQAAARLQSIRVPLSEMTFKVDPSLPSDMTVSSTDPLIWGDRWPWVEQVIITLKTERQKEGFDTLFKPDKLKQLRDDFGNGSAFGVTHAGLLTSGGRIMER